MAYIVKLEMNALSGSVAEKTASRPDEPLFFSVDVIVVLAKRDTTVDCTLSDVICGGSP